MAGGKASVSSQLGRQLPRKVKCRRDGVVKDAWGGNGGEDSIRLIARSPTMTRRITQNTDQKNSRVVRHAHEVHEHIEQAQT